MSAAESEQPEQDEPAGDSAGVYFISVDEFEARRPPRPRRRAPASPQPQTRDEQPHEDAD